MHTPARIFSPFFCTARADFALGIAPAPPKIERFLPRVVKKTRGILTPIEPQRISQTMQPSWAGGIPSSRARTEESIKSLQESSPYRQMTLKKKLLRLLRPAQKILPSGVFRRECAQKFSGKIWQVSQNCLRLWRIAIATGQRRRRLQWTGRKRCNGTSAKG